MPWSIAQAKQRFSELVRTAQQEPQLIYNRNQLVAAVVGGEEFGRFEQWRATQTQPSLAEECDALRALLEREHYHLPMAVRMDRPNAFVERLAEREP
jgi:prevent-host-death family protein